MTEPNNVRTQWQPTPISAAETAWELLEDIIKAIDEEPRRYDQQDWMQMFGDNDTNLRDDNLPNCGTVCCIAGWAVMLKKGDKTILYGGIDSMATALLGLDVVQSAQLFTGAALEVQLAFERSGKSYYGTTEINAIEAMSHREKADLGIRHIRRFMADNEMQLRAHRVEMPPPFKEVRRAD